MEDYVIIFEPKPLEKPEFRLYYDENGKVLFYTCEKPAGNYVIIDASTYAAGRPDLRVINGKISNAAPNAIISKLIPNNNDGVMCVENDVSIIVDKDYDGPVMKWKMTTYEL